MRHRRFTHFFRRTAPARRAVAALAVCALPRPVHAQALPAPSPPQAPLLAAYRTPVIALVEPAGGGSVPQDRPVVVFRFAQGEPNDAIDARSFSVTIDGADITRAFRIAGGDAWGSLAGGSANPLAVGMHEVIARICSERGTCGSTTAPVAVATVPAVRPEGGQTTSK